MYIYVHKAYALTECDLNPSEAWFFKKKSIERKVPSLILLFSSQIRTRCEIHPKMKGSFWKPWGLCALSLAD